MTPEELAHALIEADSDLERRELIESRTTLIDKGLARLLLDICLNSWAAEPNRSLSASKALRLLSQIFPKGEMIAYADWADGIAAMIGGELRRAVTRLSKSRASFEHLDDLHTAASTQIAKLYPLAMLGRYDEAIADGLWAREIFVRFSDHSAIVRIEHNLGNILQLSERYKEAEEMLRSARERLLNSDDLRTLAQVTNSLAFVLSNRYKFVEADELYAEAYSLADRVGLVVTKAEIESNIGYFSLFQARYDRALEFLGKARSSYELLGMFHQSAKAELEMADAYLELNLHAEAASLYKKTAKIFAETGMSIEHARSLANLARISFAEGETRSAQLLLTEARQKFVSCKSSAGEANVLISLAQFWFSQQDYRKALATLGEAEIPLTTSRIKGSELDADLLRAECLRMTGQLAEARTLLEEVLSEADQYHLPLLASRSLTALGLTAEALGDTVIAERYLIKAVETTENLRSPLPSEDFRASFFVDKVLPYREMMRLCLQSQDRIEEAFDFLERARSRSLIELTNRNDREISDMPADLMEKKASQLRVELNWLYNQINQPGPRNAANDGPSIENLHRDALEREVELGEIFAQRQIKDLTSDASATSDLDLPGLQKVLGDEAALVEYTELNGNLIAFVVTNDSIKVVSDLCTESAANDMVQRLYFQIDALRSDLSAFDRHLYELTLRTRKILGQLYDALILPLTKFVGNRHLIVAPYRSLNYIPFHALFDGFGYLVEERDVSYTPSATFLGQSLAKTRRRLKSGAFAGLSDERIPHVNTEINEIVSIFEGETLLGDHARADSLIDVCRNKDVLHLACHGQFRAENPLFSSLKLADGWLTVRDLYSMNLEVDLVVLSACETGINRIAPGDELLGLARGFLSTGATSLVMSLWNVHDATTVDLMRDFYLGLRDGHSPARSLCKAQRHLLRSKPHPFFWAPFFATGR